jgi:NAD(P)-dependent dehydrogenase (short-subunit alcohol dehydrogenase family)
MIDLGLDGRVVFCTGAGNGIGREVAVGLAAQGAVVAVADVNGQAAQQVATYIETQGGTAIWLPTDITAPESVTASVARTHEEFSRIDGLYNGAGIAEDTAVLHEQSDDVWTRVLNVNLRGAINCIQAVAPLMLAGGTGGAIVNVSSGAGLRATDPGHAPYIASKHAVVGLTKAAAVDYGKYGIRVNAIAPGPTRTDLILNHLKQNPDAEARITGRILLARLAEPPEIAAMAIFLFSQLASFCTGGVYEVNGGELAH